MNGICAASGNYQRMTFHLSSELIRGFNIKHSSAAAAGKRTFTVYTVTCTERGVFAGGCVTVHESSVNRQSGPNLCSSRTEFAVQVTLHLQLKLHFKFAVNIASQGAPNLIIAPNLQFKLHQICS